MYTQFDSDVGSITQLGLVATELAEGLHTGMTQALAELSESERAPLRLFMARNCNSDYAHKWAKTWADEGRHLDAALTLAQEVVARSPGNGRYLDTLGWVLFKKGKIDEAVGMLRTANELARGERDYKVWRCRYKYHLGCALIEAGNSEEGQKVLREALSSTKSSTMKARIRALLDSDNGERQDGTHD